MFPTQKRVLIATKYETPTNSKHVRLVANFDTVGLLRNKGTVESINRLENRVAGDFDSKKASL